MFSLLWHVLLSGAVVAGDQASLHGVHPPVTRQQLIFRCAPADRGNGFHVEAPLQVKTPLVEARLDQKIELPSPHEPIHLARYIPTAELEQSIVPVPSGDGQVAVKLLIEGPTQSYARWLVAGDPDRNRLTSFIGTWRLMAVDNAKQRDELFKQFAEELKRPPKLRVRRAGSEQEVELPLKPGLVQPIKEFGCAIHVAKFFPEFARDSKTMVPINKSEQKRNPAVLVDIEMDGQSEQRWVFAKFPGFSQESSKMPVWVGLDCPIDRVRSVPDYALVAVADAKPEVWARVADQTRALTASEGGRYEIHDSQYHFRMADVLSSGRMVESYKPAGRGTAALQLQYKARGGMRSTIWLEMDKPRTVVTDHGSLVVSFGSARSPTAGGHP